MSIKRAETPTIAGAQVEGYAEVKAKGAEVFAALPQIEQSAVKLLDATPQTKPKGIMDVQSVITIGRVQNENYEIELREYNRKQTKDRNTFWLSIAGYAVSSAAASVVEAGSLLGISVLNPATVAALAASLPWLGPALVLAGGVFAVAAIIVTAVGLIRPRPSRYFTKVEVSTAQ